MAGAGDMGGLPGEVEDDFPQSSASLPGTVPPSEATEETMPASPSSRASGSTSPTAGLKKARDGISSGLQHAKGGVSSGLSHAKGGVSSGLSHAKGGVLDAAQQISQLKDVLRREGDHERALRETLPEVGLLWQVQPGFDPAQGQAAPYVPPGLKAVMDVEVAYFGEPYRLAVLQRDDVPAPAQSMTVASFASSAVNQQDSLHVNASATVRRKAPAEEILEILQLVRDFEATSTAPAWPIHDPKVSEAVIAMETEELSSSTDMADMPRWQRAVCKVLRALRITPPSAKRVAVFEQHYGAGVEFMFTWSAFFVQQLWLLVLYALVWMCVRPQKLGSQFFWVYEVMKVGVVIWCFLLAVQSLRRFGRRAQRGKARRRTDFVLAGHKKHESPAERVKRILFLIFAGGPVMAVTVVLVLSTFAGVTMLVLKIIFIWGDCLNLHSEESVCRDAQVKYSLFGWAAEVACDILLALLFEIFFSLGTAIASWLSGLLNYKYQSDMLLFKGMLELAIAAMERIGFVGSLAFFFVPQWAEPVCLGMRMADCDCSDLIWGVNDFRCFQRRLPVEMRRWLFEALMKGPFIVAPFISILVKVLVPKLVACIARNCARTRKTRWCCWLAPLRTIVRFFTLIFSYDGDSVKCFTFVCKGQPFELPPGDFPDRAKALSVLEQFKVKPFEVEDEMMELEMSLLWVVFFMPLLPGGVIATMIAKLIEVNSDLTKMLYVRRRPVPVDDNTMRREINAYSFCVVVAGMGWSAGLSLVTYNDDLHDWGAGGIGIFVGMAAFMFVGSSLTTWALNRFTAQHKPASLKVQQS